MRRLRAVWAAMTLAGALAGTGLVLAFAAAGAAWMENIFIDMTMFMAPVAVLQALALTRLRGLVAFAWIPATLLPLQFALPFGFLVGLAAAALGGVAAPLAARAPAVTSYLLFAIAFAAAGTPIAAGQWLALLRLPHAGRWLQLAWLPGLTLGLAFYLEFPFDKDAVHTVPISAVAALIYGTATASALPSRRVEQAAS